jgi:hypothetical protein
VRDMLLGTLQAAARTVPAVVRTNGERQGLPSPPEPFHRGMATLAQCDRDAARRLPQPLYLSQGPAGPAGLAFGAGSLPDLRRFGMVLVAYRPPPPPLPPPDSLRGAAADGAACSGAGRPPCTPRSVRMDLPAPCRGPRACDGGIIQGVERQAPGHDRLSSRRGLHHGGPPPPSRAHTTRTPIAAPQKQRPRASYGTCWILWGNEEVTVVRSRDRRFRGPGAAPAVCWSEIGRDPKPGVVPDIKSKLGSWENQSKRCAPGRHARAGWNRFRTLILSGISSIPRVSATAGAWGAAGRGSNAVPSRRQMKSSIAPHAMRCTRRQAEIVQSNRKLHTDV